MRGTEPIGRIAAIIDRNYNQFHQERIGAWGFFECLDDQAAADALYAAAEDWVRQRGMTFLRGPLNPSTNYDIGTLIEGFQYPPAVMMPYNPRYYLELAEQAGFRKEKDVVSLLVEPNNPTSGRLAKLAARMLAPAPASELKRTREELEANAATLKRKLQDFGVDGHIVQASPGPVITSYEFEPAAGVKVSQVVNLSDDLALAMKAAAVRIIGPIPGRGTVAVEVPNPEIATVYLREILVSAEFREAKSRLPLALGKDTTGNPVVSDLAAMPHLLIAGSTGSGKSVGLNTMICSLLYKATPAEVRFLLIDPKRLELGMYERIPHLLAPVVTDAKEASARLKWIVGKMDERYKQLQLKQVRNIEGYNREVPAEEKLPYWVVVVDELADLMMVSAGEVQNSLVRLAQIARAVGIHLIVATQRPSVDVVTGLIKANFPTRIAFQVASKVDSRTVLDANGAEQLLGRGDMIFLPPGSGRATRVHGCWVADNEVKAICEFLRKQGSAVYEKVELPIDDGPGVGVTRTAHDVMDGARLVIAQRSGRSPSAAPARSGVSQGGALHRHDGAGPHHRPGARGQAARDPRRPRIPRAEGQANRRMRRSLLLALAALVLAACGWRISGSGAGAGSGRGRARGDVWKDHRPARGVFPGCEQQEPRAGHQGEGNGLSEEGRQDALDYKSPAPQQIVSDGMLLWVYTPELNQVNKGSAPKALAGPRAASSPASGACATSSPCAS